MCIMEVRAGQRHSTIAQACAHNITTVERDLDMFIHLLDERGEHERAQTCRDVQARLQASYTDAVNLFAELAGEEEHEHGRYFTAHQPAGQDGSHERDRVGDGMSVPHSHEHEPSHSHPWEATDWPEHHSDTPQTIDSDGSWHHSQDSHDVQPASRAYIDKVTRRARRFMTR